MYELQDKMSKAEPAQVTCPDAYVIIDVYPWSHRKEKRAFGTRSRAEWSQPYRLLKRDCPRLISIPNRFVTRTLRFHSASPSPSIPALQVVATIGSIVKIKL